jgi:hypothetical protein
MTTTASIQDRLTAMIIANPDVRTLYPNRARIAGIASSVVGTIAGGEGAAPTAFVSQSDAGTTVAATIGVTGEHSATVVCRELHDTIAAELTAVGASLPLSIAVKIASIS